MSTGKPIRVAEYLTKVIDGSGKTQIEIARECDFDTPDMVTMLKQGKSKLPFRRITALARSLDIDPVYLLRLAIAEYQPEVWEVINELLGAHLVTESEEKILEIVRSASAGKDVVPLLPGEIEALEACVAEWTARADKAVTLSFMGGKPRGRPKGAKTGM